MPDINDLIEFQNEYRNTHTGTQSFCDNIFSGYYKATGAKFPETTINSFSLTRSSLQSFAILRLIDLGHSPEDIFDPKKIQKAKYDVTAELYEHLVKKDYDKEWVVDLLKRGAPKLVKTVDERTKDFDFSNPAAITKKENMLAFHLAHTAFDLNQEIGLSHLQKDVSPDGNLIFSMITTGALLKEVRSAAFAAVDTYNLSKTKDQDKFAEDLAIMVNTKLQGKDIEQKKKSGDSKKELSTVLGSNINYIQYKMGIENQFFKTDEDIDLAYLIMETPPLRQKFAMDYAENKLKAEVVDLTSEDPVKVSSDKTKWTNLEALKETRKKYKAVTMGLADKLMGIMVKKQLKAQGEKFEMPKEAVDAFRNKLYFDDKLASAFNKVDKKDLDKMISSKGKADKKLIDSIYNDYIKSTVNKLAKDGKITEVEAKLKPKKLTLREEIAAYGKKMYDALKKTDSITSFDSKDYKDLHAALKTFSKEVLSLPETKEGYAQLQQKLIDVTVLKNKYVESHEYLEKKSDRQIDRLKVMKDISKFTAKASASIVEKEKVTAPSQKQQKVEQKAVVKS